MKKKLLNLMMLLVALLMGGGAYAKVTTLPVTENFDAGTAGIFSVGTIVNTSNIGNVLAIGNATLDFVSEKDVTQPYSLAENEKVVISYKQYNGYLSTGKISTMELKNSDGVTLLGYTYNTSGNITDVKINGETVDGFTAFSAASYNGSKNVNGFSGNGKPYVNKEGYNPQITVSILQSGYIEISFVGKNGNGSYNKKFSGMLGDEVKKDLKTLSFTSTIDNEDRRCAIDDISITSVIQEITFVNYTIKRKCGDEELNFESSVIANGTELTVDKNPYWKDNQKYIYVSDDFSTVGAVTDGKDNVYTITYRKADTYNYTVKDNFNNTLANSSCFEGESVAIPYPKYVINSGALYTKNAISSQYKDKITPDKDGYSKTFDYSAANINNVVYYSEAENISGLTVNTTGNVDVRASNALAALAKEDTKITTLPAGKYIIHAGVFSSAGTPNYIIKIAAGENIYEASVKQVNASEVNSEVITLEQASDIVLKSEGMGNNNLLDYIYITKTAETVDLNTDHTYTTYCPATDLDFTGVEDVEVYKAKVSGDKVVTTKVEGKVKAGEGIIIKNVNNVESVTVPTTTGAGTLTDNQLVGAQTAISDWTGKNAYMLVCNNGVYEFQKIGSGTLKAGKAYLNVPSEAGAKPSVLVFGDNNATAISGVEEKAEAQSAAIYNMQGIKVEKAEKGGLYIINGKKYIK